MPKKQIEEKPKKQIEEKPKKQIEEKPKNKKVKKVAKRNSDINIDLTDIKKELNDYMQDKIDKEVAKAVDKSTKKLIHYKNRKIIRRDITIVILLLICFFLGYNLYSLSDINIDITRTTKTEKNETVEKEKQTEDDDLTAIATKYKDLVQDIYINENSTYLKNFYNGKLTDELKLYLALNNVDNAKITSEDGTIYLESEELKNAYNNLFDSEYNPKSFKYGNLNFKYLSSKELFIADGSFDKETTNINREFISIEEKEDILEITTIEGLIKDNKLYNIITGDKVKYEKDKSLKEYQDYLTKVTYYFNKVDDNYKLTEIK